MLLTTILNVISKTTCVIIVIVSIKDLELTHRWQINQHWQTKLGFQWLQGYDEDNNIVDDGILKCVKLAK